MMGLVVILDMLVQVFMVGSGIGCYSFSYRPAYNSNVCTHSNHFEYPVVKLLVYSVCVLTENMCLSTVRKYPSNMRITSCSTRNKLCLTRLYQLARIEVGLNRL